MLIIFAVAIQWEETQIVRKKMTSFPWEAEELLGSCNDDAQQEIARLQKGDPTFTDVYIPWPGIGEGGGYILGTVLAQNTHAKKLNLTENDLRDGGTRGLCEGLQKNSSVETLVLDKNRIADAGAENISIMLIKNSSILSVSLSGNTIRDLGASYLGLMLRKNHSLRSLRLGDNKFGVTGFVMLAEGLAVNTTLRSLQLSGFRGFDSLVDAELLQCSPVSTISGQPFSADSTKGSIAGQMLREGLAGNVALEDLDVQQVHFGVAGGLQFGQLLQKNQVLSTLKLASCNLGADGGRAIAEALERNHSLTQLDVSNNGIGAAGGAFGQALLKNTTLTLLNLELNGIRDPEARTLAFGLRTNSTLRQLGFSQNFITGDGAQAIGEALILNTTLTSLTLSTRYMSNPSYDAESAVAQALHQGISANSSLTQIDLNHLFVRECELRNTQNNAQRYTPLLPRLLGALAGLTGLPTAPVKVF